MPKASATCPFDGSRAWLRMTRSVSKVFVWRAAVSSYQMMGLPFSASSMLAGRARMYVTLYSALARVRYSWNRLPTARRSM